MATRVMIVQLAMVMMVQLVTVTVTMMMAMVTPPLQDPREEVMTLERVLLQTIKFDLQVGSLNPPQLAGSSPPHRWTTPTPPC